MKNKEKANIEKVYCNSKICKNKCCWHKENYKFDKNKSYMFIQRCNAESDEEVEE